MAAPKGNLFALGNNGGRPSIYDGSNEEDIEKVNNLIISYFDYILGERGEKEVEKIVKDKDGNNEVKKVKEEYWVRKPEPPTITGLTVHLGFSDKSTLYDYKKKEEFSHLIKRAITCIENYHEIQVAYGDKCTGNIFVLKNMEWDDKSKIDLTGNVNLPVKEWGK